MAEERTLKDLVRELAEERGFDLRGYKPTTLERRVRRRMQQLNIGSYDEYLNYIRRENGETGKLLDTVLINVTRFFRDVQAWDVLAEPPAGKFLSRVVRRLRHRRRSLFGGHPVV